MIRESTFLLRVAHNEIDPLKELRMRGHSLKVLLGLRHVFALHRSQQVTHSGNGHLGLHSTLKSIDYKSQAANHS